MTGKSHVAVRLDEETLVRLDALQPVLDAEWREATRSDLLRLIILHGLEHFEKKHRAELDAASTRGKRGAKAPASRSRKKKTRTGGSGALLTRRGAGRS